MELDGLPLFDEHPDPVARRDDPETSWEAAASVEDLSERRAAVYWLLRRLGPSTDEEIAEHYPRDAPQQSPSGLRTRRSELVRMGFVEFAGEHKKMTSGRRARVWRVTGKE